MELFTKKLGFAVVQLILVCCDYNIRPMLGLVFKGDLLYNFLIGLSQVFGVSMFDGIPHVLA